MLKTRYDIVHCEVRVILHTFVMVNNVLDITVAIFDYDIICGDSFWEPIIL
jgi:hypothetical protein